MFGTTPQSISSIHRLLSPQAGRRGRPQQRKEGELQEVHHCSSSMQVGVNDAACSCESTTSGGLNRPSASSSTVQHLRFDLHRAAQPPGPPNRPSTSSSNSSSYKPSRSTSGASESCSKSLESRESNSNSCESWFGGIFDELP